MPTRIGNRSYPTVSEGQRSVMSGLLNDPGWEKLRIGNRSYDDPRSEPGAGETTGSAPPVSNKMYEALQRHATGLGKDPNDLSLDELNGFLRQHYDSLPTPKQMYQLPRNYY